MKIASANGTRGFLIYSHIGGKYLFRVYDEHRNFKDYEIFHSDLSISIDDPDAFFYEKEDGRLILDHSPETLGLK